MRKVGKLEMGENGGRLAFKSLDVPLRRSKNPKKKIIMIIITPLEFLCSESFITLSLL